MNQTMKTRVIILMVSIALFGALPKLSAENAATNKWESVAAAGVTLARGNTHNFLATGSLNSTRKWEFNEVLLGMDGGYGETTKRNPPGPSETTKTEDFIKGFAQWNHLFTPRI